MPQYSMSQSYTPIVRRRAKIARGVVIVPRKILEGSTVFVDLDSLPIQLRLQEKFCITHLLHGIVDRIASVCQHGPGYKVIDSFLHQISIRLSALAWGENDKHFHHTCTEIQSYC